MNILKATDDLYSVITKDWIQEKNTVLYRKVLESLEVIKESLIIHSKELFGIEQALINEASRHLTEKQQRLLQWIAKRDGEDYVYTSLIDMFSIETKIPKSTVRWNLRGLRESGLILAGDKENKGIPVTLTDMGKTLAECLESWS